MANLKLGAIHDEKPVKIACDLPAATYRDLCAYADALGKQTGQPMSDPARLVGPMIERFMASDRAFRRPHHTKV